MTALAEVLFSEGYQEPSALADLERGEALGMGITVAQWRAITRYDGATRGAMSHDEL